MNVNIAHIDTLKRSTTCCEYFFKKVYFWIASNHLDTPLYHISSYASPEPPSTLIWYLHMDKSNIIYICVLRHVT